MKTRFLFPIISLALFFTLLGISQLFTSCRNTTFDKYTYGNCSDGIRNQNEEDVDCGGYCLPCTSCNDGVKNAGETGIDCGGACQSCDPVCTITPSTTIFTIHPPNLSSALSQNATAYSSFFYTNSSYATISFAGGSVMNDVRLTFNEKFNPFANIPLNQTMIFQTVDYGTFNLTSNKQIEVRFYAAMGFDDYYSYLKTGQSVYLTRTSQSQIQVQFCNLTGAREDIFSLNVVLK